MDKNQFLLETIYDQVQNDFEDNVRSLSEISIPLSEKLIRFKYSLLYSHPLRTLKPGNLYFLGINPKGENNIDYELETYTSWVKADVEYNSLDSNYENWGGILQNRCKDILNFVIDELRLDINYKDIIFTNFNFFRSNNVRELLYDFEIQIDSCWKYHKQLLEIVLPKIIICNGNSNNDSGLDSPYRFLRDNYKISNEKTYHLFNKFLLKKTVICIPEIGEILLIGIPHLSRFPPNVNFYNKLKSWIQDFNVNS